MPQYKINISHVKFVFTKRLLLIIRDAVAVFVDILSRHVFFFLSGLGVMPDQLPEQTWAPAMSNPLFLFLPIQVTPWLYFIDVTFSTRTATSSTFSTLLRASQSLIITLVSEPS